MDTRTEQALPAIQIYNTMSRRNEPFETIEPGHVRMYVCGVTPYDSAHIGHAMSVIVFDVIRRYLEYRGYDVSHAYNFTDVDDKIIARAERDGIDPADLADSLVAEWLADTTALNVLPATVYPRVTQEIGPIIALVESLVANGSAYEVAGDVYFRVRAFSEYGKLSHRDLNDLLSGARIEIDERKEDPLDFALWKAAKPGEPQWPSPFGPGRPGWHIECSAMALRYLDGRLDIHGGGADLIFPHHENEIAQSEAATPGASFARYWVHNGLLQLGGEKMSKSLGNFIKAREVIERGLADAFRLLVLQSHYRVPLTFSEEGLEAAERGLSRLRAAVSDGTGSSEPRGSDDDLALAATITTSQDQFHTAMSDDFNSPVAVAALFDLARVTNRAKSASANPNDVQEAQAVLRELSGVLGLRLDQRSTSQGTHADVAPFIDVLIDVRNELRAAKQWAIADRIRDRLSELGVTVEDGPDGATWRYG